MTHRLTRVCVIGAGLTGLACALAAAAAGLRVQVFDAAASPPRVPAHVEVVPSMLRDLVALGVGEECVRTGFAYHGIDVFDRYGQHLYEVPTARLAGRRFPAALGMCHADLHQVLERAALSRGVATRWGARVQEVREQAHQTSVVLADGESVDADLVVLACGAGSELRMAHFPQARQASELPQAWWYALLPRPTDLNRPLIAYGSPGRRAVLVPVRHDIAGIALTEPLSPDDGRTPGLHLREALSTFAPRLRALADRFDAGTSVVPRPARTALLEAPWHRGAVLAVGDCAHAFPPHFGQSAAQAVEDASVLAELLAQNPDRAMLLEAFQRRRAERVRQVHEITETAARWDLHPDGAVDLSALMRRLAQTVAQPA